jgi:hypothetical protein
LHGKPGILAPRDVALDARHNCAMDPPILAAIGDHRLI